MDRKIGHYRRYRKSSVVRLMRSIGFEIESAVYLDSLGFFASLVYKLIGNRSGDIDRWMVKLYDTIVFRLSRLFERMGVNMLFGKNLMITAWRPIN